jgi:hypothetical protein
MQRLVLSAEHSLLSGKKESGGKVSINSEPKISIVAIPVQTVESIL